MEKMKPTPGPWEISGPIGADRQYEVITADPWKSTTVARGIDNITDAALIAAAPELLAAARGVLTLFAGAGRVKEIAALIDAVRWAEGREL